MNSTLFAAFGMLSPMHGFLRRFGTRETFVTARLPSARARSAPQTSAAVFFPAPPSARPAELAVMPLVSEPAPHTRSRATSRSRNRANLPLRVVRVMDNDHASAHGERMMISGRMADVCAELDRMAEREARQRVGL
jgi:hypothetical protein